MKIRDFIGYNERIKIISNNGKPTVVPHDWRPLLNSCDILVAIPDMHMYDYDSPLDGFRFGAEAMLDFLEFLEAKRFGWPHFGKSLKIFQLGDLHELWFPNPRGRQRISSHDIWKSHPLYDEISRLFCLLKIELIIGNHDYRESGNSNLKFSTLEGKIYMEHGFRADQWYHFSNPEQFLWRPAMGAFKAFRRIESEVRHLQRKYGNEHSIRYGAWGNSSGEYDCDDFTLPQNYRNKALDYFSRVFKASKNLNQSPRLCIVAHTHLPFIHDEFIDRQAIYLDAGAWSHGRSDFAVITNEELAVCSYARKSEYQTITKYRQVV